MDVKKDIIDDIARQTGLPSEKVSIVVLSALRLWSKDVRPHVARRTLNFNLIDEVNIIAKETGFSRQIVDVVLQLLRRHKRLLLTSGYRIKVSYKVGSQRSKSKHYSVASRGRHSKIGRSDTKPTMRKGGGEGDDPDAVHQTKEGLRTNMATKEEILAVRKARSEEISKLVRFIAFGIVAMVYSTLSSSSAFSMSMADEYEFQFLLILIFSTSSIVCDYLQFLFGYIVAKKVNLDKPDNNSYSYKTKSAPYFLVEFFYWLKQFLLIIAVIVLMYIMIKALF